MLHPPLLRQCGHHLPIGLLISTKPMSLQQSEQDPQLRSIAFEDLTSIVDISLRSISQSETWRRQNRKPIRYALTDCRIGATISAAFVYKQERRELP